jgi:hypothetical protein
MHWPLGNFQYGKFVALEATRRWARASLIGTAFKARELICDQARKEGTFVSNKG